MLIVVVSPSFPRFDATTHYWQAEFASVVAFLRGRFPYDRVVAVPAGLICAPDRVIVRELLAQPDFLILWSRVFEAPAAKQIADLTREISPRTRILSWGDGPLFMPQYYAREPFDGAVGGGDAELVLADAIERLAAGELPEHGMLVKSEGQWVETGRGRWLEPALWPFPDLDVIAFDDYQLARELRGKPTDDLSFDVSRGCHVGCSWCVDPFKGGRRDRRRPVEATLDFMGRGVGRYGQFQLHGPIFTQDRPWIDAISMAELHRRGLAIPFKAVTLVNHLAEGRLVGELASVGMRAVGFGIETLTVDRSRRPVTPKVAERLLVPRQPGIDKFLGLLSNPGGFTRILGRSPPMNKKFVVRLSAGERSHLESLVAKGKAAARRLTRARILLKADCSPLGPAWSDEQISDALDLGAITVHRVRRSFVEGGLDGVLVRRRIPRRRRMA